MSARHGAVLALAAAIANAAPTPSPTAPPTFVGVTCGRGANASTRNLPWCDTTLSVAERVERILEAATVPEKIAMLDANNPGIGRLGLRPMQFGEGLHGVDAQCGKAVGQPDQFGPRTGCPTSYPAGVAEGATFDRDLWRRVGAADGREGRALHNQNGSLSGNGLAAVAFWAPDMNLVRDPRWGRAQEVPGEDPFLTSEYVRHFSAGLQYGDVDEHNEWIQIISTCKHFFGYDMDTNRTSNNVNISQRMLQEYYLPVFRVCVQDVKARGLMCSYNEVNGVPSCANSKFQNGLVRDTWGWDGYIVSDCGAITNIYDPHNYTHNWNATVAAALHGGTDIECDNIFTQHAAQALASGAITVADLDTAIRRRLPHFIALGELEGPDEVPFQSYGPEMVDTTEHRLLALEVAEKSMTLLKNEPVKSGGEPLLPLSRKAKIALVGPHANFTMEMLSNYEGANTLVLSQSPIMAARRAGLDVIFAPGHSPDVSNPSTEFFFEAVGAAQAADVAVVMVGLCADHCAGNGRTENEGNDRGPQGTGTHTLGLPGAQQQLLEAVYAVQHRTVVVLINGGMLDIRWAKDHVPAILEAYYPGELAGTAIWRTLLGDNNPGGKAPVTWYPQEYVFSRNTLDMDLASGQGLTHMYYKGDTIWPFGWGLSYTSFAYKWANSTNADRGDAAVVADVLVAGATVKQTCTVTNTGRRAGDAVILGFVANSTDPLFPRQKLFDFARVTLAPGESKTVTLEATAMDLSVIDERGARWVRPATYQLRAGDVVAPATAVLRVGGEPALLEDISEFLK